MGKLVTDSCSCGRAALLPVALVFFPAGCDGLQPTKQTPIKQQAKFNFIILHFRARPLIRPDIVAFCSAKVCLRSILSRSERRQSLHPIQFLCKSQLSLQGFLFMVSWFNSRRLSIADLASGHLLRSICQLASTQEIVEQVQKNWQTCISCLSMMMHPSCARSSFCSNVADT